MATQPDPSPDSIEPQSPDEIVPPLNDPAPSVSPPEQPEIAPDFDEPGGTPDEAPVNPM